MISTVLSVLAVVVVVAVHSGSAFECYFCNSADIYQGEECKTNIKGHSEWKKNCSQLEPRDGMPWERCRVMVQDVEGDSRVIRDCATKPPNKESKCIDRTGTAKIKIRYCECDGDSCNAAPAQYAFTLMNVFALLFAVYFGGCRT